jgi:hypothetical protein
MIDDSKLDSNYTTLHRKWRAACEESQSNLDRALEAERLATELRIYQDAYEDLVERLCAAFDCPNPAAIVEHIQATIDSAVAAERARAIDYLRREAAKIKRDGFEKEAATLSLAAAALGAVRAGDEPPR